MSISIGVLSYNNPEKFRKTIQDILSNCSSETKEIIIFDNNSNNEDTLKFLDELENKTENSLFKIIRSKENLFYQGGVNRLFEHATQEIVVYVENDVEVSTPNFDLIMRDYLWNFHEIGIIFPNWPGSYMQIDRGKYMETDWAVGCMFGMSKYNFNMIGGMDEKIGHQVEVDLCLRTRMAGLKCAMVKEFTVKHHCSATTSPEQQARITRGVQEFINKWNSYLVGAKNADYYSPDVLRWEDFPLNRIYRREYFKPLLIQINRTPRQVGINGVSFDLISEPKTPFLYRD